MNLVLALDPLPTAGLDALAAQDLEGFAADCELIPRTTARLTPDRFPQDDSPFVQERFRWTEVNGQEQAWVADEGLAAGSAVVGHNLKIAWNMTRVGNWLLSRGGDDAAAAAGYFALARRLATAMRELGIDQVRSGVYDVVEHDIRSRQPPLQFGWLNSNDFWQQEQGILA